MIKSKKQSLIVIGAFILVLLLGTTTYAFFNYTRTGSNNTIRVGKINFITRQLDTINLTNVFPIDKANVDTDTDNVGSVVIEIVGDTDYSGGIEYLVSSVDSNISVTRGNKKLDIPISIDVTVDDDLGVEDNNYFTSRNNTNTSIYKKLVGDVLVGDQMLLVGYIKPNTTSGTTEGIDAIVSIKAYFDKDKILISDTYDGTESDNMGTSNSLAEGKTVVTTNEWNSLQSNGLSFKVKVEANEGIWVIGSLEEIMKKDNIGIDLDNGVDYSLAAADDSTAGIYTLSASKDDTNPILYYRGNIEDNNVVFGNQCWKAVRTTDTGGVKLVYSGTAGPEYEQAAIQQEKYNIDTNNTDSRWSFDSSDNTWNIELTENPNIAIEFTVSNGNNYTLDLTGTSGSDCGGSYRFYKNGSEIKSSSNGGGSPMDLSYYFGTLSTNDTIKMDFSGSASETCPITFKLKVIGDGDKISDLGCTKTGVDTYISIEENGVLTNKFQYSPINYTFSSPAGVGYMYGDEYIINSTNNFVKNAKFGSDFTWDGTYYTLIDDTVTKPNSTHHYSCNLSTQNGSCQKLRFVYYDYQFGSTYYIELENGDDIDDALNKMFENKNDSHTKEIIDTWYEQNMTSYTNKLEDTIWCNDRSIGRYNGWTKNGQWTSGVYKEYYMLFGSYERSRNASDTSTVRNQPSLACANKNDRFTVNNGNGNQKLDYPIAMLTYDEVILAGGADKIQNNFYLTSDDSEFWTMSPHSFTGALSLMFTGAGHYGTQSQSTFYDYGIRPAISLKPGQLIKSGDGTTMNPYVIE